MGWKPLKKKLSFFILLQPFYVISITILTLLLPLSFLLLSRLSNSHFSIQTNTSNIPFLFSLIFSTNPSLLHILVSIITILSLFHTLTGRVTLLPTHPGRSGLYAAWVFLCAVQVCVVLGIHATTEPGSGFKKISWSLGMFSRAVFFVGVHETMMCWSRIVVRPVVDDAMGGGMRPEKWEERVVMTVVCGGLWWLRLREEVEALAGAVEPALSIGVIGVGDFVGWWLYFLTVSIGMARVLKGIFWVGMVVFFRRFEDATSGGGGSLDVGAVEEQV